MCVSTTLVNIETSFLIHAGLWFGQGVQSYPDVDGPPSSFIKGVPTVFPENRITTGIPVCVRKCVYMCVSQKTGTNVLLRGSSVTVLKCSYSRKKEPFSTTKPVFLSKDPLFNTYHLFSILDISKCKHTGKYLNIS